MASLLGTTALITGGSRGLGLAIATHLSKLGCSINLVARNESLLKENIKTLSLIAPTQSHTYITCDLSEPSNISRDLPIKSLKDVSILVNCAGITQKSLLMRTTSSETQQIINTNLTSSIVLTSHLLKSMIRSTNQANVVPIVINVSSVLALDKSLKGTVVYSASKAGLIGFTKSLANELDGRIRCNAVLPGLIKNTEMSLLVKEDIPMITMEDVCDSIEGLILDNEANGQCVAVDV